jgi:UDP-N-acetylmuramoyl-tripeptide--D-alanyl-D-alanine ligase
MKNFAKKIIIYILIWESKLVLKKYKPKIIAVTGSVGKTSTKDAIYTAMLPFFYVRKSAKSYNSEIGIPLTILGVTNGWSNFNKWIKNILHGLYIIIFTEKYPEWLILEIGADRPGDIASITKWVKPDISVITRIGKVPVHVEFYKSVADVVKEKRELALGTKKDGVVILNADDEDVLGFKEYLKSQILTYSIVNPSDIIGSHHAFSYSKQSGVTGMTMKVDISGSSIPVKIHGIVGKQQLYPILGAFAVAHHLHLDMLEVGESFTNAEVSPGRMNILEGKNGSTLIDDTYNSSPVALEEAVATIGSIRCRGKKIAILGDMLELGRFSGSEHKKLGEKIAKKIDILIVVGIRAKNFALGAIEKGFDENNIFYFDDSVKAGGFAQEIVSENDLVYLKGSQGMRLERTVEALLKNPERKKELLVRQDEEWISR